MAGKHQKAGHIPRPRNAFMVFAGEYRKVFRSRYPDETNANISVRLGDAWRALENSDKTRYYQLSKMEELEHRARYPNYQYCPNAFPRKRRHHQYQSKLANFLANPGMTMGDMSTAAKLQALTFSNLATSPSCAANSMWPSPAAMQPPMQNLDLGLGTVPGNDAAFQATNMYDISRLHGYQGIHAGLAGVPMSSGHPGHRGYWPMAGQTLPSINMLYMGLEHPQLGAMHSGVGGGAGPGGCCMHMKRACSDVHHHVPVMPVWRQYPHHAQLHNATQPMLYQQAAEPVMIADPATMTLEQTSLADSDTLPDGAFHLLNVDTLNENLNNNNNDLNLDDDNGNNDVVDDFINTECHVATNNETQNALTKIVPGCVPVAWIDEVAAVVTSNLPLDDDDDDDDVDDVQVETSITDPEIEEPVTMLQL